MNEPTSRVVVLALLLIAGVALAATSTTPTETVERATVYQKGTYLGPADTALSGENQKTLRSRARTGLAPRI